MVEFKPKLSLSALDLAACVYELQKALPARVNGVQALHSRSLSLELYVPNSGAHSLVLDARGFMFLTDASTKRVADSQLALSCSRLKGLWLRSASQLDFDRVVTLEFSEDYKLVFELVGKGNIVLLKEGRVVSALNYFRVKDRVVEPGSEYTPPPPRGVDLGVSVELKGETLLQALVHAYNCPAELMAEALFRVGVEPSLSPGSVDGDTVGRVKGVCAEIIGGVRGGMLEPNLVFSDGEAVDVHPILFKHQGLRVELRPSFSSAVAEYYEPALKRLLSEEAVEELSGRAKRLLTSAAKSRQAAQESAEKAEALRSMAEALSQNPSLFELALRAARNKSAAEVSSLMQPLGLSVGEVNGISLVLSFGSASFRFDPRRSAYDNLGSLYDEVKSLRRKHEEALRAAEELERQAKGVSVEADIERKRVLRLSVAHRKWFEKYRWFFTSANKLVIAGRDAQQNQAIVKRYAKQGYTALHADIQGAPLTLLMAESDDQSLYEAAQFAASYSRAWSAGLSAVDVFYADASSVSLQPPAGEYLPRGGVMFHEKNYVRGVTLELSVGFLAIEGEPRLNAWPSAAKVGYTCARIVPGEDDKDSVAKRLLKILRQAGGEYQEYALTLRVDELLPLIPGPSRIVGQT